ncbi:MAG: hypothetical protein AB7O52_05445 [Planctomycetota bacterium]
MAWVLVVAPPVVISCHTLQNNDLPMHLAVGNWILDHREVPDRDPFSANGSNQTWVPHEWLAAVGFASVERAFGAPGLLTLTMLLAGILAVLHRGVMKHLGVGLEEHLWLSVPLWIVAGQRLMLRPHMFSLILVFAVWWVLFVGRSRPRVLWFLPLLLASWANLHGSFYLGLGIVALGLGMAPGHRASARQRWLILAACAAALLVTPHPIAGVLFPLTLTSDPVFMQEIAEWSPPFGSARGSELFRETPTFALSLLWIAAIAYGVVCGRRLPLPYRIGCAAALVLYMRHQRYAALFVLATLPFVTACVARLATPNRRWIARLTAAAGTLLFLYPGYPATWNQFRGPPTGGGSELWGANLPLFETELLVAAGYRGTVVCEYEYGGVLAWKSRGTLRPTMDSRNTVYGAQRFLEHQTGLVTGEIPLLGSAVAAVIRSPWVTADRARLHARLEDDPQWRLALFTPLTFVYVRVGQGELDARAYRYLAPGTGRIRQPLDGDRDRLARELEVAGQMGWHPSEAQWTVLASWGIERPE